MKTNRPTAHYQTREILDSIMILDETIYLVGGATESQSDRRRTVVYRLETPEERIAPMLACA